MDLPLNEDLVSGLLTALNQFTIMEFQQGIESIDMGGLRWVYLLDKATGLLFIAAGGKEDNAEILRARLIVIRQAFIQEYIKDDTTAWRKTWTGNVEKFYPFKETIDQYYSDWIAAESVMNVAEFFDVLGIFQQLLFNVLATLNRVPENTRDSIHNKIEDLFENYKNDEFIKENPELGKISFSRESGVNIITINPNNCDIVLVQKQIINLVVDLVETVKIYVGFYKALKFFIEEDVFEYILNNIGLLHRLNLDKFLLKLFLMK